MIDSFQNTIPDLPEKVESRDFEVTDSLNFNNWSSEITGSDFYFSMTPMISLHLRIKRTRNQSRARGILLYVASL